MTEEEKEIFNEIAGESFEKAWKKYSENDIKNIKKVYEILVRIKNNLENVEDGDYSYDRCFNNILELTNVALEYIRREL